MSTTLPLPRGFFDTNVRLSEDARRRYIELAESSIRQVFALSDSHRNAWIPVREKKAVAVYRNFSHTRNGSTAGSGAAAHRSNIAEVGCKASMHASLDEIGRAYAAHDDALFRRLQKKLNPGIMDAAVLFTIVPRTPHTPFRYIGIKWFAVKTPTPLVSHRDYCCLEVQDKITDSYGNEMYIRILNSIEITECPSLENSHALVRAKILSGYMYRSDRAEPNLIRVHHVARFDPSGYFPSQWAYKTAESQLISSVVQIRRIIEKQQMNACTFVDKKQWVPNHERQNCAVCNRNFGTFRPRHHCRCCGEVICGKCSVFKSVDVPGTTIKNVRICSICNMGVQKSAGARDMDTMSDISTSSVTSSQTIAHNEMNMMDLYLSANNPGTPSAYSSASSTNSNLSFRSTASSRSVLDARSRGFSSQSNTGGLYRTGSQRGGFFGSRQGGQTPRSFYDSNTPRSYIANNLTPRDTPGFDSSGNVTPRSDNGLHTPSAATQRMSIFKQNPLDLGYLRESLVSNNGLVRPSMSNIEASASVVKAEQVEEDSGDADMLESSAVSTTSPLSSSNSTLFAEEKEVPHFPHPTVVRSRAMTTQPRVLSERSERDSSSVGLRNSASTTRKSTSTVRKSTSKDRESSTKKPFFGGFFSRTTAAAASTTTETTSRQAS